MDRLKTAPTPWVIVAGGFHQHGGMDKANAALATFLLERKIPLHLVAHHVDPELSSHPGVRVHLVPRPAGSFFLGERLLDQSGRAVAQRVVAQWPGARVIVNGSNCIWPDINWVHYVHHEFSEVGGPIWFRTKDLIAGAISRRRESRAISAAKLLVANSERTRSDLIRHLNIDPNRVHTVYLGAEPDWRPPSSQEIAQARLWLCQDDERPLVVFVGALAHDQRKGFDTLWSVWRELCAHSDWDANLVVVGDGRSFDGWRSEIAASEFASRVWMLGRTKRVRDVLAAADLLVSPVRYEAFGLNVQEAICRGVPALTSRSAGVAELYPAELSEMLLRDPDDWRDLADLLLRWRSSMSFWKKAFQPFGNALRSYTWKDMARRIVEIVEGTECSSVVPMSSLGRRGRVHAAEHTADGLELKV